MDPEVDHYSREALIKTKHNGIPKASFTFFIRYGPEALESSGHDCSGDGIAGGGGGS